MAQWLKRCTAARVNGFAQHGLIVISGYAQDSADFAATRNDQTGKDGRAARCNGSRRISVDFLHRNAGRLAHRKTNLIHVKCP
ncbi:hypothetical protein PANT111_560010 [Pantoea brenneri]|uniref:Uncharacterized protein n=1 Tax=Pantoea brenneri TaxID=472694 RepID=A0AAX3JBZ5_9GAMM|nr:hypothetical protein PANT111_560010 [Pantoea brenneri]